MIIDAEKQQAEEIARRERVKATRQGLTYNDILSPVSALVSN